MHYCQHLATSEPPQCLPPTTRPCTWHPKSGPRAWKFGSPAAAAAWAVGTAHPGGPQEGAETGTPQPDVTGEAQVVKSEHMSGESGDEGQGPEADAKPDRKRDAKRISSTIKAWYLSFQAVKERDGWTRARAQKPEDTPDGAQRKLQLSTTWFRSLMKNAGMTFRKGTTDMQTAFFTAAEIEKVRLVPQSESWGFPLIFHGFPGFLRMVGRASRGTD